MTQQHPITPPPELMHNLGNDTALTWLERLERAYQLGADQELEACLNYMNGWGAVRNSFGGELADELRAVRRPKPPSLKEQALDANESRFQ